MSPAVLERPVRSMRRPRRKAPAVAAAAAHSRRLRARTSLIALGIAFLALNATAMLVLDEIRPGVRDPEYARRVNDCRARVVENPGRPLVLVIGSSRAAMGVCPTAWETARSAQSDPLLFNLSLIGSGPVQELMVARRAFADGLQPRVVLFEYWPPFLASEGDWSEPKRVPIDRLSPIDREVVRDYFPDPDAVAARMRQSRWNPISAARQRLLAQLVPKWFVPEKRIDRAWQNVDDWGWKPGFDLPPEPTDSRTAMLAACRAIYQPLLADYRIAPDADRALREAIALTRRNGADVGLLYLPESSEFRGWYSPGAERLARDHLAGLSRELAVPVIDARAWMADGFFADGFHLTRRGAAEFTRRLGPAAAAAFPEARP